MRDVDKTKENTRKQLLMKQSLYEVMRRIKHSKTYQDSLVGVQPQQIHQ